MASKRPAEEPPAGVSVAKKPKNTSMVPLDIGPAAGEDDLNIKVHQIQNQKLSERLRERNRGREMLEERVAKLEQEQETAIRFRGAVKAGLETLRDCLAVTTVTVGLEEGVIEEAELREGVKDAEGVGKVFRALCATLENLAQKMKGCGQAMPQSGDKDTGSAQEEEDGKEARGLALLKEISCHYRKKTGDSEEVEALETKCETLEEEVAQLRFSLESSQVHGDRLETHLQACLATSHAQSRPYLPSSSSSAGAGQGGAGEGEDGGAGGCGLPGDDQQDRSSTTSSSAGADGTSGGGVAREDKSSLEEGEGLQAELAEARELARSRQEELQKLSTGLAEAKKEVDGYRITQQALPEAMVKESAFYKSLQCQFTMAMQDGGQLRVVLEEARTLLMAARQQHFTQLEEIRGEELKYQGEVREEMAGLEAALATVKRDYELLRIEYERTVASNEQAGPVAKELRLTVDSLQKSISQHKSEVARYKTRTHKAEQQLTKLQEEKEEKATTPTVKETPDDLKESFESTVGGAEANLRSELKYKEAELESLKQAASTEERERAEVLASEKKTRIQVEELKKKFEDYRRDYEKRKEHIREEAARKTRSAVEDNRQLQKELGAKKQEAQALVEEMEYTTQAFEEMQEQNIRLLQQLKEKDDANLKLMSERIKANGLHKILAEEKELLQNQLNAVAMERQRYAELVSSLEEREVSTEATLQIVDKELSLHQQASEGHRKQTQENVQQLAQLQLQLVEHQRQLDTAQKALTCRAEEWDKEAQLHRKSVEDMNSLRRKLEKYKSREWMAAGDEVLLEEIKMYRAKLNCPCCSTRKKDTVLTKCFHVFCSECIRQRYDSRLRKCPKCGAPFGANDFHKIYLS